uniref:Uncharacterized protein n=1 Tax=Chromera velia CCMP2878 TaxID=1169474 RepID=A0A0G4HRV4_9ALVE|eukprot:Cvel_8141.t1-p1 / transcript=Cvel_8141.t1 / gene=Cvel_8141 / organism=Chromera_velia_CCMP2878 / gene_product=hypothetical protein / transcript_product=hypothetical protein / location=Cvel_scaffold443:16621-18344(-) / protein_length=370 / sequence_SO=supercontig / SO=protein_coding / is_pseudo=false
MYGFRTVEGHVVDIWSRVEGLQRMVGTPSNWSARSRFCQSAQYVAGRVSGAVERVVNRHKRMKGIREMGGAEGRRAAVTRELREAFRDFAFLWEGAGVSMPGKDICEDLKRNLAMGQVDRSAGDIFFVCPRVFGEGVKKFFVSSLDYKMLSEGQVRDLMERLIDCSHPGFLGSIAGKVSPGEGKKHKFGVGIVWLKWKTFQEGYPASLALLKWRPLVSYAQHAWKRAFGMGCRMLNGLIVAMRPHGTLFSPFPFIEAVAKMNDGSSRVECVQLSNVTHKAKQEVSMCSVAVAVHDIKNFFPSIPRALVLHQLRRLLEELKEKERYAYIALPGRGGERTFISHRPVSGTPEAERDHSQKPPAARFPFFSVP